jgi:hypothetical protein
VYVHFLKTICSHFLTRIKQFWVQSFAFWSFSQNIILFFNKGELAQELPVKSRIKITEVGTSQTMLQQTGAKFYPLG